MILGIMQPYFLPYFEHFRLLAACDQWVVFDIAQFSRKSWISRNRILNREKGMAYISVPVRHTGLATKICDAELDGTQDWKRKLCDRLRVYCREAPFYDQVQSDLSEALAGEFGTIAELNLVLLNRVSAYLGIDTPMRLCSELDLRLPAACPPGEWALHIAQALGATEYRNPSGGRGLFDESLYARHGIRLTFHEHRPRQYATGGLGFVADLSVVDWMMWNDPRVLRSWLH